MGTGGKDVWWKRALVGLLGLAIFVGLLVPVVLVGRHYGWSADDLELAIVGTLVAGALATTAYLRRR